MRKIIISTIALVIFSGLMVQAQIRNEVSLADIELIKQNCDSQSIKYLPNSGLSACFLLKNLMINDFECKGKLTFYEGNKLHQLVLHQPYLFNSFSLPTESILIFDTNGFLKECWLSENVSIGDIEIKGGLENGLTTFHSNGKLKSCNLAINIDIQGVPCSSENMNLVYFYPNGKLRKCTLTRNINLNNVKYLKGSVIEIGIDGQINKIND